MDVVVQPSVPWMSLNDQIKDSGLFFPVDPGPSVSGALLKSRCACGITQIGNPNFANEDHRLGSEVWLAQAAGIKKTPTKTMGYTLRLQQWNKCRTIWHDERMGHQSDSSPG